MQQSSQQPRSILLKGISCGLKALLLVALLCMAGYIRLHGLTKNGIVGADPFQYWNIAVQWSQGNWVFNDDPNDWMQYFRPVFFWLNMISLKIFGFHDYALKGLIGIFDVFNVLLVFFCGRLLWHRYWLAWCLALLYALAPLAIYLAQIELAHIYSLTFVLLMFICFLIAINKRRKNSDPLSVKWLVLSGFFMGCASLVHGSVSFFAPTMVGALYLDRSISGNEISRQIKSAQFIRSAAYFTLGFFIPYFVAFIIIGFFYSLWAIASETTIRTHNGLGRFSLYWTLLTEGITNSSSFTAMIAFLGSAVFIFWRSLEKNFTNVQEWLPCYIVFVSLFCFAMCFKDVYYTRLLLPQLPFIFMTIIGVAYIFGFRLLPKKLQLAPVFLITGLLCYYAINAPGQKGVVISYWSGRQVGAPKAVYDVIGKAVNPEQTLLIAPSIYYVHRRQFNAAVYFDKNAIYLYDCATPDFSKFLQKNKVHYVYIAKSDFWDPRILESHDERDEYVGACFNRGASNYSADAEIRDLQAYLTKHHAILVWSDKQFGDIWQLRNYAAPDKLTPAVKE